MEEIDIIELLQRVKEGNAPKIIRVRNIVYKYRPEWESIETMYVDGFGDDITNYSNINFDTKIKILDKPIIEKLECINVDDFMTTAPDNFMIMNKINEIIKRINEKN